MKTQKMTLKEINQASYNPRKTLVPGNPEWEALKGSIGDFGLVEPLVVNIRDGRNILVGGHQRYNVLKATGVEETRAIIVDLDEKAEKQLNLALNRIEGMWDYEKLEVLFEELSTEEILRTGFSQEEISDILKDYDFGSEDGKEADTELTGKEEKSNQESEGDAEKPFQIFLSFPSQEEAKKWLTDRGLNRQFPNGSRNLNIRMEGVEYGAD